MEWRAIAELTPLIVKDVSSEGFIGFFEGIAATPEVDLEGDRFSPEALARGAEQLRGRPILLLHGRGVEGEAAVGEVLAAEYEHGVGLRIKAGIYAGFRRIWELVKNGALRALSIGGVIRSYRLVDGVREIVDAEIREVSLTPRGVNPSARILSFFGKSYIITSDGLLEPISTLSKAVVEFREVKTAPEETRWDADAALQRVRTWASRDGSGRRETIDWEKYRQAFAWYDASSPDSFGSYKLPHHDVVDGELVVVWRGVAAAMAALAGARGGVSIPEEDRRGVYEHLAAHYRQFGREPPRWEAVKALSTSWSEVEELVKSIHESSAGHDIRKAFAEPAEAVVKEASMELDTPILRRIRRRLVSERNKPTLGMVRP